MANETLNEDYLSHRLEIANKAAQIIANLKNSHILKVMLVGSVAKKQTREDSDVDLLVVLSDDLNEVRATIALKREIIEKLKKEGVSVGERSGEVHVTTFRELYFEKSDLPANKAIKGILESIKNGEGLVLYSRPEKEF